MYELADVEVAVQVLVPQIGVGAVVVPGHVVPELTSQNAFIAEEAE